MIDNNLALSADDSKLIKGVAICLMLWHHLFPNALYIGDSSIVVSLVRFGKVCVSLFLLVSGYGMSLRYSKVIENVHGVGNYFSHTIRFLMKRFLNFYAGYWIIFILFVSIGVFAFGISLESRYETDNVIFPLIVDFFGFMGYHSYNITWWFNRTILLLYIAFPLIFFLIRKIPYMTFIAVLGLMLLPIPIAFVNEMTVWLLPFFLGMFWAMKLPEGYMLTKRQKYLMVLPIAIVLCGMLVFVRMNNIVPYFTGISVDGFLAVALSVLVILLLRNLPILSTSLSFLGKHSANIYMVHTFLFSYWVPQLIYSPKYAILIFYVFAWNFFAHKRNSGVCKENNWYIPIGEIYQYKIDV